MKQTRRISALLLLAALLAGCGTSDPTPSDTSGAADTSAPVADTTTAAPETSYLETLPHENYDGFTFVMTGQSSSSRQNFWLEDIENDVINDSIHERDTRVTERLGCNFSVVAYDDRNQATQAVVNSQMADQEDFHLLMNALSAGVNTWLNGGYLYDLASMPYLSLESSRWCLSMVNNMSINGKLFFTTGGISPQFYQTPIAMGMNQRLGKDRGIDNIYQIVLDGKWTVDKMYELTSTASQDLNSDGTMTADDFYGLAFDGTFGNVLFNSAGINSMDEAYELTIGSEAAVNIVQKCAGLFGNRSVYFNDAGGSGTSATLFKEGRALFMDYTISGFISFRDMEDDFAIIPTPKWDESQDNYYTTCNTWLPSGVCVPRNCSNPERTALIMETLAYYSSELITPAVYETTLRGRVSRDADTWKMLDIIYADAYFDMVTAMNFNNSATLIRDNVLGEKENFVSEWKSIGPAAQIMLDEVVSAAAESGSAS